MVRYLITRHSGAIDWLSQQGLKVDKHIEHLDNIDMFQPGDEVIGVLPFNIVAALCDKGVKYYHLDIRIPVELRGVELSAQQLEELGATLTPYHVVKLKR